MTTTCYRHPDRVAGVTCQRCDRPICPQCMVQASVGFQCPECTRSRPQQVITARTAWGGGGSDVVVGKILIGLNVAAYVLMTLVGGNATRPQGSLYENAVTFGPLVAQGEWWRLVTGGFLHAGPLHLLMNMFLLWLLAKELEPALGHVRFAAVYGVSLLGGALGVMIVSPDSPTLGASGAVFGLMGALIVLQLRGKQNPWNTGLGGLVLINLLITFTIPGISVGGHVGGLIAGALAGAAIQPLRWPQTTAAIRTGFVVVMGVLIAVLGVVAAGALATDIGRF